MISYTLASDGSAVILTMHGETRRFYALGGYVYQEHPITGRHGGRQVCEGLQSTGPTLMCDDLDHLETVIRAQIDPEC